MPNLHFDYTTKLMETARAALAESRPKRALDLISKAFAHVEVLVRSPRIRGDLPLERVESRRRELIELVSCLPPSLHH